MCNKIATKKNDLELINKAQEEIIKGFINSLTNKEDQPLKSKEQYRQVVNALSVDEAFTTNITKNFMELLLKLLAKNVNDNLKIEKIIDALKKDVEKYDWNRNGKKSYKTYINRFICFLEGFITDKDKRKEYKGKVKLKMDPVAEAALRDNDGELYLHNILFTKFKSRLRCQDRTSGPKIWLPLRFIAKLYSKDVNGETVPSFSEWLDELVNGIYIHYKDNEVIRHVKFDEKKNISLLLKKTNDTDIKYRVYVKWNEENDTFVEHLVYTPTGRGNKKVPMEVERISDIAIDHVKSIDQTLKENASKLEELKKVSDYYKELLQQDGKDPTNDAAKSLLKKIDLNKLIENLKTIGKDSPLRLMSSEYNSNKSNGDTFKRIIKDQNDNYFGILMEEIIDDNKEKFILYQNLKENGIMRIRKDKINGQTVESKDYIEIIDLI